MAKPKNMFLQVTWWTIKKLFWLGVILIALSLLLVLFLRWVNPPTTAMILQDDQVESVIINRTWTPLENIAHYMPLAVIASEDQKFPTHHGFDFEAINEALNENRTNIRGASTITQQLSKNLFLWPGRSYVRKGVEAWFTVLIELTWPKQRIMEVYLNVIEFGPGVFGITSASQQFYQKSPTDLDIWDASTLAAVLPNPKVMSAQNPSTYVWGRASDIQTAMRYLGGQSYLPWE